MKCPNCGESTEWAEVKFCTREKEKCLFPTPFDGECPLVVPVGDGGCDNRKNGRECVCGYIEEEM